MDEQFPRPALSIGGDATDFGDVTVETAAALRRFTVTNTGSGAVSISAVTLDGPDAAAFEPMGDDCAGETLRGTRAARCASASPRREGA